MLFDRPVVIQSIARAAFLLGAVVMIILALLPDLRLPPVVQLGKYSDIAYHLGGFFVLTALAILATYKIVPPVVWMTILAFLLEFLQAFVPGREVFLSDLAASLAGVVLGAVCVTLAMSAGRSNARPVRLV